LEEATVSETGAVFRSSWRVQPMSQGIEKTYNAFNLILGTFIGTAVLATGIMWAYQNGDKLLKARDEWFESSVKANISAKPDYLKPLINNQNQINWDQQMKSMQSVMDNHQRTLEQFKSFQPPPPRFGR
jgi:hypothetical protein